MANPDRTTVAQQAHQLVFHERAAVYGDVLDDHGRTAELWNALFRHKLKDGEQFQAEDVSAAMRMLKESRLQQTPGHRDSLVDIVGYCLTQEKAALERTKRAAKQNP